MLPLLAQVGRDAGHLHFTFEEHRVLRRGAPAALRFDVPGGPLVRFDPVHPPAPLRPPRSAFGWLAALWPHRGPRAAPSR